MTDVERALQLKKELDALRPLKREDELRIMQKFRLDWNYHSNHLEGNTLTFGETKALILFGITAKGKPLKDHIDITGHNDAIKWIEELLKQKRPLTENFIRELHQLILKEPYFVNAITADGQPTRKQIKVGVYKTTPNHVQTKTGEIFRFATPEETPALMADLINWYREKIQTAINPMLLSAEFHYKFIRIHPFDDGNGRTARILMNFILMQNGYPPVVIKTEDKENYFAVLRQADAGMIEPFIEYIAQNLNHSLDIMIKGAKGQNIEEEDDLDKELALLEQKFKGIGSPIEVIKSEKTILKVYGNSIKSLISFFNDRAISFQQYYVENESSIRVNDNIFSVEELEAVRRKVSDTTSIIAIKYFYKTLNRGGFKDFNYNSEITFSFDNTQYSIRNTTGFYLQKLYNQQLSKSEIQQLVDTEIRKHIDFLAQKIDDNTK